MDGKSMLIVFALLMSGAGFAGCIEAPGFLQTSDAERTALASKGAADAAALAWSPEAKLVSVMTIELTNSTEDRVPADPEVGNGRALAWWYVYSVETEETMDVRAYRVFAGEATEEKDAAALATQAPMGEMQVLKDWMIDSDAAIASAKTDDRFRLAAQGFNASVVQGVATHDGQTAWWIVAGSVDGIVVATVDATNGTFLDVRDLDLSFAMPHMDFASTGPEQFVPEPLHLEGEGELEGDEVEFPFSVAFPMRGDMVLGVEGNDGMRGATWAIYDEDGEWVAGPRRGFFPGMSEESGKVEIDEPGDYTLVIREASALWVMPPLGSEPMAYAFTLHLDPIGHEAHDDEER